MGEVFLVVGGTKIRIPIKIQKGSGTIQNLIKEYPEEPIEINWDEEESLNTLAGDIDNKEIDLKLLVASLKLAGFLDFRFEKHQLLSELILQQPNLIEAFNNLKILDLTDLIVVLSFIRLNDEVIKALLSTIFEGKTKNEMFKILGGETNFRLKNCGRTIWIANHSDWFKWTKKEIDCLPQSEHHLDEDYSDINYYLDKKGNLRRLPDCEHVVKDKIFKNIFISSLLILEDEKGCLGFYVNNFSEYVNMFTLKPGWTVELVSQSDRYWRQYYFIIKKGLKKKLISWDPDLGQEIYEIKIENLTNVIQIRLIDRPIVSIFYRIDNQIINGLFRQNEKNLEQISIEPSYMSCSIMCYNVLVGKVSLIGNRFTSAHESFVTLNEDLRSPLKSDEKVKNMNSRVTTDNFIIYVLTDQSNLYYFNGFFWRRLFARYTVVNFFLKKDQIWVVTL